MKKVKSAMFILFLSIASLCAYGQNLNEDKIPVAVKTNFVKQHPLIKSVSWQKKKSMYEAVFDNGVGESSVLYNSRGKWIEKETVIAADSLPLSLRKYVDAHYPGYKLKQATLVSNYKSRDTWQIVVVDKTVIFEKSGKFLKEEKN